MMRHASLHSVFHTLVLLCGICSPLAAELRPLSTDRPDTTESPHTVDAGHFQLEMEIAAWTRDGGDTTELTLGELNAKVGLNDSTDLQLVLPVFTRQWDAGEGIGDIHVRVKHNLWGNDEGSSALAVMPYVKIPTAGDDLGNGDFEGGLIVPFGFDGPDGWSFGVMGEADLAADEDDGGYHLLGLFSVTASHDVTHHTGVFFEIVGIITPEGSDHHEAYFNSGMVWALSETLQIDGGVRVGLTHASADFSPFVGVSTKF